MDLVVNAPLKAYIRKRIAQAELDYVFKHVKKEKDCLANSLPLEPFDIPKPTYKQGLLFVLDFFHGPNCQARKFADGLVRTFIKVGCCHYDDNMTFVQFRSEMLGTGMASVQLPANCVTISSNSICELELLQSPFPSSDDVGPISTNIDDEDVDCFIDVVMLDVYDSIFGDEFMDLDIPEEFIDSD